MELELVVGDLLCKIRRGFCTISEVGGDTNALGLLDWSVAFATRTGLACLPLVSAFLCVVFPGWYKLSPEEPLLGMRVDRLEVRSLEEVGALTFRLPRVLRGAPSYVSLERSAGCISPLVLSKYVVRTSRISSIEYIDRVVVEPLAESLICPFFIRDLSRRLYGSVRPWLLRGLLSRAMAQNKDVLYAHVILGGQDDEVKCHLHTRHLFYVLMSLNDANRMGKISPGTSSSD